MAAAAKKTARDIVTDARKKTRAAGLRARGGETSGENFGASWVSEINVSGLQFHASVRNEAEHARYVERGRRPGKFPPPDEIEDWILGYGVALELGPGNAKSFESAVFLISRKIARKGTKGHWIMREVKSEWGERRIAALLRERFLDEMRRRS